jgi:hypothetical protein
MATSFSAAAVFDALALIVVILAIRIRAPESSAS